jgi:type IV pilus assembly protein PilM
VAKRFVSIDIGAKFIKLVEVSISGAIIDVVDIVEKSVNSKNVKSVLKDVVEEKKVDSDILISLISRKFAVIRTLHMPKLKTRKLRQIIPYELEPYLAVPIEEVSVDFLVDHSSADKEGQKVLVAAIPKKNIREHIELFKDTGVEPGRIDLDAFALIKGIEFLLPENENKTLICIDIGYKKTSLNILNQGSLLYSRILSKAFYHIIQEIKEKYNLDEKAIEKKFKKEDINDILKASPPLESMRDIINDIKLSLKIYLANPRNKVIDALLITGGAVRVTGLTDYISKHIEIPLLDINHIEEKKDLLSAVFALGGAVGGH